MYGHRDRKRALSRTKRSKLLFLPKGLSLDLLERSPQVICVQEISILDSSLAPIRALSGLKLDLKTKIRCILVQKPSSPNFIFSLRPLRSLR